MAEALKITSADALRLGVVDEVISEPLGGAHRNTELAANRVKEALIKHIDELSKLSVPKLLDKRYRKFRNMGAFEEVKPEPQEAVQT